MLTATNDGEAFYSFFYSTIKLSVSSCDSVLHIPCMKIGFKNIVPLQVANGKKKKPISCFYYR